jgi:hypothetical protein
MLCACAKHVFLLGLRVNDLQQLRGLHRELM